MTEYRDADVTGIDLPQAVCWERLKYSILPRVDIPCRIEFGTRRVKIPVVRTRLRTIHSDDMAYVHTVQMYLHRITNLGAFGPKFSVFCHADGRNATFLHLRADSDRAFPNNAVNRLMAWSYGIQWRMIRRIGDAETDATSEALRKVRVYFDDVLAYDFGQLTKEGLTDGFHRRAYAHLANILRTELINSAG